MTSQMKNVRAFAAATAFCLSNEVRQEPMVRRLFAGGDEPSVPLGMMAVVLAAKKSVKID